MCMQVKVVRKRRRSLVRFLASCVPNFLWEYFLPVAPKTLISVHVMEKSPLLPQHNLQLQESNSSFFTSKCVFRNNLKQHCCCQLTTSNPKPDSQNENPRIVALQSELEEIKGQIAKLMEHQTEYMKLSDVRNLDQRQKVHIPAPPPPPPPLPSSPVVSYTPLKIEPKKKAMVPQNGFLCGKELLRDLKKVQLKKIEKSPGGGPLKKPKEIVNSPEDIVDVTVKKRLELFQKSPESGVRTDESNLFESGSHRNTPEKFLRSIAT